MYVWGFLTQVYAAPPPTLVVCSSLSLCVSPFLYLSASALLEFLVLSGAAGALGSDLSSSLLPGPATPHSSLAFSQASSSLQVPLHQFLVAKSGETQEARLPAPPSGKAPPRPRPHVPPTHSLKIPSQGWWLCLLRHSQPSGCPGPLPAHCFPIHTQSAQLWAPRLSSWGTLTPQLPVTSPPMH